MTEDVDWGVVRSLDQVIAANHRKLKVPVEFDALASTWVRNGLDGLKLSKALYEHQDRRKTKRVHEALELRRIADSLAGINDLRDAVEHIRSAYEELGENPDLSGSVDDLRKLTLAAAKRFERNVDFKLARRWRPYIYGSAIPEIGWRQAKIRPTPHSKALDDRPTGICFEFVRACLKEMKEEDASPSTISRAMKGVSKRVKLPHGTIDFEFTHPWGAEFNHRLK